MCNMLFFFINQFNILPESQFGFRKGHSTKMAMKIFFDKVVLDQGEHVMGVFYISLWHLMQWITPYFCLFMVFEGMLSSGFIII